MLLSDPEQSLLMKEALTKMYNYVVLRDNIKSSYKLKNTYRNLDIVIGRAVHNMTFKELADEYGVCVETIRVAYYRNLAYFAKVLKKEDLMDLRGYQ